MHDYWRLLGISPTQDKKQVKKAYAKQLKQYSPEDDPESFQQLRQAYEAILVEISHNTNISTITEIEPVQTAEEMAVDLFKQFIAVLNHSGEQSSVDFLDELLASGNLLNIEVADAFEKYLFQFLFDIPPQHFLFTLSEGVRRLFGLDVKAKNDYYYQHILNDYNDLLGQYYQIQFQSQAKQRQQYYEWVIQTVKKFQILLENNQDHNAFNLLNNLLSNKGIKNKALIVMFSHELIINLPKFKLEHWPYKFMELLSNRFQLNLFDYENSEYKSTIDFIENHDKTKPNKIKFQSEKIQYEQSTIKIKKRYLAGKGNIDDLFILWLRYDWIVLNQIRLYELKKEQCWYRKIWANISQKTNHPHPVAYLFQGVSVFENGYTKAGIQAIENFAEYHATDWQPRYTGVVLYYRAKSILLEGDREQALIAFLDAYQQVPLAPIKQEILKLGYNLVNDNQQWIKQQFPNYQLPLQSQHDKTISLQRYLSHLQGKQIIIICLLADNRLNYDYSEFIVQYQYYQQHCPFIIQGCHIISEQANQTITVNQASGVAVLYDHTKQLADHFQLNDIPTLFVLRATSEIIAVEALDNSHQIWDALLV